MELLSRLRRAVKKLTFLLNLKSFINQSSWRFVSLLSRARAPPDVITGRRWRGWRALSFSDRPGLRACEDLEDDDDYDRRANVGSEGGETSGATSPGPVLRRTASSPIGSPEEDVDKKAEMFIAWFREQLNYERQISLDLRYCKGYSFDESYSSDDTNVSPLCPAGSQLVVSPT